MHALHTAGWSITEPVDGENPIRFASQKPLRRVETLGIANEEAKLLWSDFV